MLNLLISADPEMWESNSTLFPRDRCLTEYIVDEFRFRFSAFGSKEIEELKTIPTIFAYESIHRKDAYIGKITGIFIRQKDVRIDYVILNNRILYNDFVSLDVRLDLGKWELNRTHWTIKNVNLEEIQYYLNNNRKPKVFISYSWTPPENQKKVFDLIGKLTADSIQVIYDKKDLKPGQNKNYFMEQSLTDKEIGKVLVICNRDYAEKANNQQGGVGYESEIIISQIASKPLQTKFIPVVVETDERGEAFLPTSFLSRKYIDLTKESGYRELLSAIQSNDDNGRI